jgi:hypothetical protein
VCAEVIWHLEGDQRGGMWFIAGATRRQEALGSTTTTAIIIIIMQE